MIPLAPAFRNYSTGNYSFPEPSRYGTGRLILSDKHLSIVSDLKVHDIDMFQIGVSTDIADDSALLIDSGCGGFRGLVALVEQPALLFGSAA